MGAIAAVLVRYCADWLVTTLASDDEDEDDDSSEDDDEMLELGTDEEVKLLSVPELPGRAQAAAVNSKIRNAIVFFMDTSVTLLLIMPLF